VAAINSRLLLDRAQNARVDPARASATAGDRVTTRGTYSSEPNVGTGRDDAWDRLASRLEYRPTACQSDA
jgi:hypothetical protein